MAAGGRAPHDPSPADLDAPVAQPPPIVLADLDLRPVGVAGPLDLPRHPYLPTLRPWLELRREVSTIATMITPAIASVASPPYS